MDDGMKIMKEREDGGERREGEGGIVGSQWVKKGISTRWR